MIGLILLTVGCRPGKTQLTVSEYADWCGERVGAELQDPETWADAAKLMSVEIDAFESVIPPDELEGYHLGTVAVVKLMHDHARGQDADELFNPHELREIPNLLALGLVVVLTTENWSPEVSKQLAESGCIEA